MGTLRKADLHLHSRHSGWQRIRLIDALDCYLDPVAVVETALERGMDYAALTDHDSVGGWVELFSRRPDLQSRVIPGVEVEATFPGWGLKVHINVLGLTEAQHLELQRLRPDAVELLRYARAQELLALLNHPLRTLWRHPRPQRFMEEVMPLFGGYEAVNSASPEIGNRAVTALARLCGQPRILVGGSDAHTLSRVGFAYTVAEGDDPGQFLENVRQGRCAPGGSASGLPRVIADVYSVVGRYYASLGGPLFRAAPGRRLRNLLWSTALLPGSALLPAFLTSLNDAQYRWMARWMLRWAAALEGTPEQMSRLRTAFATLAPAENLRGIDSTYRGSLP